MMRFLFLFSIIFTLTLSANLKRNGSLNVVIDTEHRLAWMDEMSNVKIRKTHQEAEAYCENLSFAGFSDWRLPKIEEFELIVDKKNERSYINRAFRYNMPVGYWAEKAHWRTFWFYADYMFFVSGTPYYDSRHKKKFVRCVRDIK